MTQPSKSTTNNDSQPNKKARISSSSSSLPEHDAAPVATVEQQLRQQESLMRAEAAKLEELRIQVLRATTGKILHITQQYKDYVESTNVANEQIQKNKEQINATQKTMLEDQLYLDYLAIERQVIINRIRAIDQKMSEKIAEMTSKLVKSCDAGKLISENMVESGVTQKSFLDLDAIFEEEISRLITNCGKHNFEEVKAAYPDNIAPLENAITQFKLWQEKKTVAQPAPITHAPALPLANQYAIKGIPGILNQFKSSTQASSSSSAAISSSPASSASPASIGSPPAPSASPTAESPSKPKSKNAALRHINAS